MTSIFLSSLLSVADVLIVLQTLNFPGTNQKPQEFERLTYNSVPFDIPTRYKAIDLIGAGAYGQVISAKGISGLARGRLFAIKKLENICRHPVHAKRAVREVSILRQLNHEGIIPINDVYMDNKLRDLYIVSPLMDTDLHSMFILHYYHSLLFLKFISFGTTEVIRSSQKLLDQHVQFFIYQILRSLLYMQSGMYSISIPIDPLYQMISVFLH